MVLYGDQEFILFFAAADLDVTARRAEFDSIDQQIAHHPPYLFPVDKQCGLLRFQHYLLVFLRCFELHQVYTIAEQCMNICRLFFHTLISNVNTHKVSDHIQGVQAGGIHQVQHFAVVSRQVAIVLQQRYDADHGGDGVAQIVRHYLHDAGIFCLALR